jgi:hypothetical protein
MTTTDTGREQLAKWMIANTFATGNGDTFDDLLNELTWQVRELRNKATDTALLDALKFYADGHHFIRYDADAWDTVSGEPQNFYEDESSTATVEDGSIARAALQEHGSMDRSKK